MTSRGLRLLSLDGGGVRGLSTLFILRNILERVAGPGNPIPKPCEFFDLIGGTSTGGLIAVMLGRLGMTVDECIEAYIRLSKEVFGKRKSRFRINLKGDLATQFDAKKLEEVIRSFPGWNELLATESTATRKCKVFVCAVRRSNGQAAFLRSYPSSMNENRFADHVTVLEACRATSAAPGFFDPIAIGPSRQELVDGGLEYNNPVEAVYSEARDIWDLTDAQLQKRITCLISLGTGVPKYKTVEPGLSQMLKTLSKMVSDTQKIANRFRRDKAELVSSMKYFRFNVDNGLQGIGLEEHQKQDVIVDATDVYLDRPEIKEQLIMCSRILGGQHIQTPYRLQDGDMQPGATSGVKFRVGFSLAGVPFADKFVDRPEDMESIRSRLLQGKAAGIEERRKIYVLHGMGGIGKTQLAAAFFTRFGKRFSAAFWLKANTEQDLRQSLVKCARRIPSGAISESSRMGDPKNPREEQTIVEEVLEWLGHDENHDWLLVFDNVDLDPGLAQDQEAGAFEILEYLRAPHGAALITTRLPKWAQLAESDDSVTSMRSVDPELSRQIFLKWFGLTALGLDQELALSDLTGQDMLGGLPLAIAQAAIYIRKMGISISEYQRRYAEMWPHVMDAKNGNGSVQGYARSVGTTWSLSLQQVEAKEPHAGMLVRTWAFLDNKDFWFGLLSEQFDDLEDAIMNEYSEGMSVDEWRTKFGRTDVPFWLKTLSRNEAAYLDCMNALLDFGLVEKLQHTEAGSEAGSEARMSYTMHPVVHAWAMQMQSEDEKLLNLQHALYLFINAGVYKRRPWAKWRRWLPHATKCIDFVTSTRASKTQLRDVASIIGVLKLTSDLDKFNLQKAAGFHFLETCVKSEHSKASQQLATRTLVPWAVVWEIMYLLGILSRSLLRSEDAEEKYAAALRLSTAAGGRQHLRSMLAATELASIYAISHDKRKAEKAEKALVKISRHLGAMEEQRHGSVVAALVIQSAVILGLKSIDDRRYSDAEEQLRRALQATEHGSALPDSRANAMRNLGTLCNYRGKPEEAEAWLRPAYQLYIELYGPHHPVIAITAANLAWALSTQNRHAEMQEWLAQAFHCKDMSTTVTFLGSISSLVWHMEDHLNNLSGVEPVLRRAWDEALQILRAGAHMTLSNGDVRVLSSAYYGLTSSYSAQGRMAELEEVEREMAPFDLNYAFEDLDKPNSAKNETSTKSATSMDALSDWLDSEDEEVSIWETTSDSDS